MLKDSNLAKKCYFPEEVNKYEFNQLAKGCNDSELKRAIWAYLMFKLAVVLRKVLNYWESRQEV
jgi:hypothetical protein